MERLVPEHSLLRGDQNLPPTLGQAAACPRIPAGEIYLEHAPMLRRVAVRKFDIPAADAEALVHDVFAAYLASPGAVRTNLKGYLVAAICNASRNYWRSRRTEERVFTDEEAMDVAVPEDLFDGLAVNLVVAATLARLGSRCREVLRRYYLDGEETRSIAEAVGISPGNVNHLRHVCKIRAREIYEEINRVP